MKNVRTIFLFPIISAVMIWGCRQEKSVSSPPLRLPVAEVIAGDVPVTMSFVGQIYGRNDITIQARVSGFLRSIHFKEGSFVRKGELLYVIEPQPYEAQTARSTAAVRQAEAEMIAARQNYDRVKPLAETSAASTPERSAPKKKRMCGSTPCFLPPMWSCGPWCWLSWYWRP